MIKKILAIYKYLYSHPLAKNHKIAVFKKFIFWQIFISLGGNKSIFNWINNSKLIISKGEASITGNYYTGLMEYEYMLFLLHFLKKENTFIDVGANSGVYSILSSKVIGCKTIAFEPNTEAFERLIDNININRIDNKVSPINKGVGSAVGELYFSNDADTENKVSINVRTNTSLVPVTTLDNEMIISDAIYVLKVDVEGFEMEVLKGARNLLKSGKISCIIIETNGAGLEFGYTDLELHNFICSFGYSAINYDPLHRKIEHIKSPNNIANTIYLANVEQAKIICKNSKKIVIHSAFNQII